MRPRVRALRIAHACCGGLRGGVLAVRHALARGVHPVAAVLRVETARHGGQAGDLPRRFRGHGARRSRLVQLALLPPPLLPPPCSPRTRLTCWWRQRRELKEAQRMLELDRQMEADAASSSASIAEMQRLVSELKNATKACPTAAASSR